jgi:tricorn protease-like protein
MAFTLPGNFTPYSPPPLIVRLSRNLFLTNRGLDPQDDAVLFSLDFANFEQPRAQPKR